MCPRRADVGTCTFRNRKNMSDHRSGIRSLWLGSLRYGSAWPEIEFGKFPDSPANKGTLVIESHIMGDPRLVISVKWFISDMLRLHLTDNYFHFLCRKQVCTIRRFTPEVTKRTDTYLRFVNQNKNENQAKRIAFSCEE